MEYSGRIAVIIFKGETKDERQPSLHNQTIGNARSAWRSPRLLVRTRDDEYDELQIENSLAPQ
jgi:hypothetical protein